MFLNKINLNKYISRLLACWFNTTLINLIFNSNFNNIKYNQNNLLISIIIFIITFLIYSFLNKKIKKVNIDSLFLLINYAICTMLWLHNYNNLENEFLFLLSITIIFSLIIVNFINNNEKILYKIKINNKLYKFFIVIIITLPTIILLTISILRYYTFSTPNFDFGIFSHIFYNLKENLMPYSTCERDYLLSHFAVHFSPIFYLILPIYYIFSHPITLQVFQVLILYSGVIPIIKLAKHFKLTKNKILIIVLLYCFYPALSAGCLYDFHENCFLLTFLLWVFYLFEKDKRIPMFIMCILTLMIKEDAAIYLMIFSLYIIITKKKKTNGFIILITSIIYFLIVSYCMNKFGLGIMSDRYENLIYNNSGLIGAIKTIFINPGYALSQILTNPNNNFNKIIYILKIFLPLMFLPLITKKISRYILIIPLLINILTNYIYMYDITFQYSFGIIAFLFYASIQNLKDLNIRNSTIILSLSIMFCLSIYYISIVPALNNNLNDWNINKNDYKNVENILKSIPSNASVSSSTFYLPHLTNRKEIYETYYHGYKTDIDYVVFDTRYADEKEKLDYYLKNNYEIIIEKKNYIKVLKRK